MGINLFSIERSMSSCGQSKSVIDDNDIVMGSKSIVVKRTLSDNCESTYILKAK